MQVLVTGGAGFIGSHLLERLSARGDKIRVIDNLSSGTLANLKRLKDLDFKYGDLLNAKAAEEAVAGCDVIFHLAAQPEVRFSSIDPMLHFQQNVTMTLNLLEAIRKAGAVKLIFTSSSTVYGEASIIPTPEDYAPLTPLSVYGASKLACEALIVSYAQSYDFKAVIYRLANIVGLRSKYGVVKDFMEKLTRNSNSLEILGDGSQNKSYLYIDDCIGALMDFDMGERVEIFNVGSEDQIDVKTIARIVCEEMKLENVDFTITGGVDGGRGWKGDVKNMLLSIEKIMSFGWRPKYKSAEAVRLAARKMIEKKGVN